MLVANCVNISADIEPWLFTNIEKQTTNLCQYFMGHRSLGAKLSIFRLAYRNLCQYFLGHWNMEGDLIVFRFARRILCQYFSCHRNLGSWLFISLELSLETSVNILSDIEKWKVNLNFSHLLVAICVNISLDTETWVPKLASFACRNLCQYFSENWNMKG